MNTYKTKLSRLSGRGVTITETIEAENEAEAIVKIKAKYPKLDPNDCKVEVLKKYLVSGKNIEYLGEREIEAGSLDEAENEYLDMWNRGMIIVGDSEVSAEAQELKIK